MKQALKKIVVLFLNCTERKQHIRNVTLSWEIISNDSIFTYKNKQRITFQRASGKIWQNFIRFINVLFYSI
jgi:hypothetical protein